MWGTPTPPTKKKNIHSRSTNDPGWEITKITSKGLQFHCWHFWAIDLIHEFWRSFGLHREAKKVGIFWKQAMVYVYTLGRLIFLVPFKKARMEFFLFFINPLWHRVWGEPSDVISMYTKCVPTSDFELGWVGWIVYISPAHRPSCLSSESVYEKKQVWR